MRALALLALVATTSLAHAEPEPRWITAVNTGAWFETFEQDAGGLGTQLLLTRRVYDNVFVGGRLTGLTAIGFGDKSNVAHVFDVGPSVTAHASVSRVSFVASAAPVLSHLKYDAGPMWSSKWTVGLGLDAGATVRATQTVGVGLHVLQNLNRDRSATGIAVRLDLSI